MRPSNWSSASVTICCAERPPTAQASRSLRWRSGSRRSVNAALPLVATTERGRTERRGAGRGTRTNAGSAIAGSATSASASGSKISAVSSTSSSSASSSPLNRSTPADARRPRRQMRHDRHPARLRSAWAARIPCHPSRDPQGRCRPGRIPGGAWPGGQRPCAREVRKKERQKASVRPRCAPSLTDDAAAEASDRTRTGRNDTRRNVKAKREFIRTFAG